MKYLEYHLPHVGKLRVIRDNELELMRSWRNENNVRANMFTQHIISRKEHLEWWEKSKDRSDLQYFMYEYEGIPSGIAAFTDIDNKCKNSCWAFYASPTAQKGVGSKIEFLILDHAFNSMDLHKLFCEVLAFNKEVINLHQKFGFQIEGIFRDQYKKNDYFVDIYRLGIFSTEWILQREKMYKKIVKLSGRLKKT